jgi:hypothetical protein
MACNCLEKTLQKTLELKKEQNPTWEIGEYDWKNKSWNFSNKGNPTNLYNEIKIEYSFPKVNGDMSKPKTETVTIYGSFCTFCGKKFVENIKTLD